MDPTRVDHSAPRRPKAISLAAWCLVVVSMAFAYYSLVPPPAVTADAPDTSFSAERAMQHVAAIAGQPHPMGSAAIAEVRSYLISELEKLGLRPELQSITVPDYFGSEEPVTVVNVMARIPGHSSTGSIALMAHYDTVPTTAGANDNTAGVSTVLEAARAILSGPALRNDVVLLFTDGEEPAPQYGSNAFVSDSPVFDEVAAVVNLEALGGSGPSMLVETSGPTTWLVDRYAAEAPNPTAYSFIGATTALIGEVGTDFDAFRNAGVPGFHFAYMRGSPIYHSPADDLDSVNHDSLQHHGSNSLAIARYFGDSDFAAVSDAGESVYFTLRPFFIQYPASWSIAAALVASMLLVLRWFRTRRPVRSPWRVVRGTGVALLVTLALTIMLTLAWILVTVVRPTPIVAESYVYLFCLVGFGVVLARWMHGTAIVERYSGGYGFVVLWVGLGLLTAFLSPGFSPLFALPALAAATAVNWDPGGRNAQVLLRFGLIAVPTVVLITPAVDFFFQMGQPRPGNPDSSIPAVAAVAFLLLALAGGLLWSGWISSWYSGGSHGRHEPNEQPGRQASHYRIERRHLTVHRNNEG